MQHLPDGLTNEILEKTDISELANVDPERAIILADFMIKHGENNVRKRWGWMAYLVWYVDTHELWRYHPGGFSSVSEWLMQPEIDISQGTHSDMLAFIKAANEFANSGIDLFAVLEEVGITKIRHTLPMMREALRAGNLVEQVGPLLPMLGASDMAGIKEMLNPGGVRTGFNPRPILYEHPDGTFAVLFEDLDFDALELMSKKLSLKKWWDESGMEIPSPIVHEVKNG